MDDDEIDAWIEEEDEIRREVDEENSTKISKSKQGKNHLILRLRKKLLNFRIE